MRDPGHPRHFTDEFKRQIVDLYNAGKPKREIMAECVPSSKNRQIRLSNFDTLMLTASGRAGAVAAGPPAA